MKMAIMQPYFFPYLGQFQLINTVDRFILCDDVQYIRHGWINRNRILKPGGGFQYIIMPVGRHRSTELIRNIQVPDDEHWKQDIINQLDGYRKKAPYYQQVRSMVKACLALQEKNVARLNGHSLKMVCDYIGIPFTIEISSDLQLDYSNVQATEDWALTICSQLGASDYYNPCGGIALYKKETFNAHHIGLHFVHPQLNQYPQGCGGFIPGLSILDVMMFNEPSRIKEMLTEYNLL